MKKMSLLIMFSFLAACSGGSSSPTTPAQIPTSTEYAGGEVTGDIAVQMGKTLSFNIKDENGDIIENLEDYTLTSKFSILTANENLSAKSIGSKSTEVTDGSCGTAAASGSNLVYTAPNNWAGVASRCQMTVEYQGSALTGTFNARIILSAAAAEDFLTYSSSIIIPDAAEGAIDTDDYGVTHMCYRNLLGSQGIFYTQSQDGGITWSTALEIISGSKERRCAIAVSRDGTYVAVAWRYDGTGARGDEDTEKVASSSNGGASFSSPITYLSNPAEVLRPSIVIDSTGIATIASSTGSNTRLMTVCTTATSCNSQTTVVTTASSDVEPKLVISDDDEIYLIWDDTRIGGAANTDVFIAQWTPNSLGTNYPLTNSISDGTDVRHINATLDRNGVPVVTWTSFQDVVPYSSNIYLAEWDPTTTTRSSPTQVSSGVDSSILPYISHPFTNFDNSNSVLFVSYGANFNDGNAWFTKKKDDGTYTTPKQQEITGFNFGRTTTNLKADLVNHSYIVWDYYTDGSLTDSDLYFAYGTLP